MRSGLDVVRQIISRASGLRRVLSWKAVVFAQALLLVVSGTAGGWLVKLHAAGSASTRELLVTERDTGASERLIGSEGEEAKGSPDFALRLPTFVDPQAALSTTQRAARGAGVDVGSFSVQQRYATSDLLSKGDLSIVLRGPYPGLIQTLGETLSRHPNVTLARASLRRVGASEPAEASLILSVWGAPASAQLAREGARSNGAEPLARMAGP